MPLIANPIPMNLLDSGFIMRVAAGIRVTDSGCWEWTGGLTAGGYAPLRLGDRQWKLHRLMKAWDQGYPPHPTEFTDHLCRNTACVNPEHLEFVTPWENTYRSDNLMARNMLRTACGNGHPYDAIASNGGRYCSICHAVSRRNGQRRRAPVFKALRRRLRMPYRDQQRVYGNSVQRASFLLWLLDGSPTEEGVGS